MNRFRLKPVRRISTMLATLLFLFGNNYCIVSAFASPTANRAGVLCHEVSTPGSKAAKAAGSCCATRKADQEHRQPVRTPGSPCCMDLAEVSTPVLSKQICVSPVPVSCVEQTPALTSAAARIPAHPPRTDLRARPLASPAGGPLALRAPPRI